MKTLARLGLLTAVLGVSSPVAAAQVSASATTVVLVRPEQQEARTGSATSAPLVELISLTAREDALGPVSDVRLQLVAFGRWDPLGIATEGAGADLQLGYVEGRALDRRLQLRAGRQLVFMGGSPRLVHLDGAQVDYRIVRSVGVRAYGGVPVVPAFGPRQGDLQFGGRAYWQPNWRSEVGASYTWGRLGETLNRSDVGVDGRYSPSLRLNVAGQFNWSLIENRIIEAQVTPQYRVLQNLDVHATLRRTAPDLWLPRTSILSVFSEEERDEAGLGAYWRPADRWSLSADARGLRFMDGNGVDGRVRAAWDVGAMKATTLIAEARVLQIPANGFVQTRVGVIQRVGSKLTVSAEGDVYFLDETINGDDQSYTVNATAAWKFLPGWRASLTGLAMASPTWERRFDVLGRVTYEFSAGSLRAAEPLPEGDGEDAAEKEEEE